MDLESLEVERRALAEHVWEQLCAQGIRVSIQMPLRYRLAREGLFESGGFKIQADLRMRPPDEDKFPG